MKLRLSILAVLAVATLAVVSCGSDDEDATAVPAAAPTTAPVVAATTAPVADSKFGGIIKGVNESGTFSLDNLFTSQFSTRNVAAHIYETVVTFDDDLAVQPQIAKWNISGDGMVFTFTIDRDGLSWHDGTPVTSADLIQSIERWETTASPGSFNGIFFGELNNTEEVSDTVFKMTFNRPLVTVLNGMGAMASRVPIMMPKLLAETSANESVDTYIGSGPYKLNEWIKGDRVELERHEGYVARTEQTSGFAGKRWAYADEIHILEIPDQTTRLAALEAGQVDYVAELANDFYNRLTDNPDLKVYLNEPGVRPFVWFNMAVSPTDDKDVRFAIVNSFDHEQSLIAASGGDPFYTVCGVETWCVDGFDTAGYEIKWSDLQQGLELWNVNDKELALERAEAAGYNGEEILLNASQDVPYLFNTSQVIFENMKDAGFNVKLMVRDHAANDSLIQGGQEGWSMAVVTNSWANSMNARFRQAPTSSFASQFSPPARMLELAELVHFVNDKDLHIQYLNEIQALAKEYTGCCYWTGQVKTMTVTRSYLEGFTPHSVMFLVNSWLDK